MAAPKRVDAEALIDADRHANEAHIVVRREVADLLAVHVAVGGRSEDARRVGSLPSLLLALVHRRRVRDRDCVVPDQAV
jgi:hypothetical protein